MTPEPIVVNSPYISQAVIDQCIARFQSIKHGIAPVLAIRVQSELLDIDILIFAYFLLFKSESPRLTTHLEFTVQQPYRLIAKIREYMVYGILNLGMEVFDLVYVDNSGSRLANIDNTLTVDHVALPGKIIPFLFITQERFKSLFEQDIAPLLGAISFDYEENHKALFDKYAGYAKSQVIDIRRNNDSIQQLARFAFYKALFDAKIFAFFYDTNYRDNKQVRSKIQLGALVGKDAYELFEQVRHVFDELSRRPAIYHFIYSTFLASDVLPARVNHQTMEDYKNAVVNLWQLTQKIVSGLVELAKNAYQHTENETGVITGRVYRAGVWQELKTDHEEASDLIGQYTDKFKKELRKKELAFLDINVIDGGREGVTNMLVKNSESANYPELLFNELEEDRERIRHHEISFQHFLNPEVAVLLNQQAKRASAHLGLLTFAKLISDIDGLVRASTWLTNEEGKERENVCIPAYETAASANLSAFGTNYHIVIPFKPFADIIVPEIADRDQTPVSNVPVLRGIETLLKYRVITGTQDKADIDGLDGKNHLLVLRPAKPNLYDRKDEGAFWLQLARGKNGGLIERTMTDPANLIAVDLDHSNINGSQLFRFLGKWELQYPNKTLLVYNLPTAVFKEVKDINELFVARKDLGFDYWNLNALVNFFSYVRYGKDQLRFYFTDMLWGKTREDFVNINKLIRKTNFNSACLLETDVREILPLSESRINLITKFPMFHSGTTLLPLDLLLTGRNDMSLFEHNAMVLLQKEIGLG